MSGGFFYSIRTFYKIDSNIRKHHSKSGEKVFLALFIYLLFSKCLIKAKYPMLKFATKSFVYT